MKMHLVPIRNKVVHKQVIFKLKLKAWAMKSEGDRATVKGMLREVDAEREGG